MTKKILFMIVSLALAAMVSGCGTTAKFVYPAQGTQLIQFQNGPGYQKKVAVVPFKDMRGDNNQAGTYFLYLIPLMPFGYGVYERPDAARMFNTVSEFEFNPSEDLAKAAALSLRESRLFKDAFFTFGGEKDKAELLFEGEIISTTYHGTMWTYGLSIEGPLLWIFGLPAGTSRNDLAMKMVVTDQSTGKRLWEKTYEKSDKIIQGLYYRYGHDVRAYSYMTQEIMNDVVTSLNQALLENQIKQ